jgi:antitoxin component HigA of HigAB toxin-antitoxin module
MKTELTQEILKELNKKETKESIIARLTKQANTRIKCEVSLIDMMEFRRDQYGLTQKEFASIIGMSVSHYNEFIHGKRNLPLNARTKAYRIGISADILLNK